MLKDKFFLVLIWILCVLVLSGYLVILTDVLKNGTTGLELEFLLKNPMDSGRGGGILSILISTLLILGLTILIATPLGLGTAILLSEFTRHSSHFAQGVRLSLDILASVPSIVFGLFGNALFCKKLGMGFSIFSGSLTLVCMILPLLIRTIEVSIRSVPQDYRISGSALAISKLSILKTLILPTAAPGVVAGLILSMGRALAETAALIFTSGYVDRMPESIWDSGRALSVHIFDLSMNVPGGEANAYRSAVVLILIIFIVNSLAKIIVDHWFKKRVFA